MNLLVQQNPMIVNAPKMKKIQNGQGGQWSVKGELFIKYQGKEKVYK